MTKLLILSLGLGLTGCQIRPVACEETTNILFCGNHPANGAPNAGATNSSVRAGLPAAETTNGSAPALRSASFEIESSVVGGAGAPRRTTHL